MVTDTIDEPPSGGLTIEPYKQRFWAVRDENRSLVCVTLYQVGAVEVVRRLTARPSAASDAQAPSQLPILRNGDGSIDYRKLARLACAMLRSPRSYARSVRERTADELAQLLTPDDVEAERRAIRETITGIRQMLASSDPPSTAGQLVSGT